MEKYPKIKTIFKRDMSNKGRIILGEYACPEFAYLKDNEWLFTEKVDGTNIRVEWKKGFGIKIGGRTDNAQIPTFLYDKVNEILPAEKLEKAIEETDTLCLYGEGYGAKIQKGGGNYISDGVDFVLFDVKVENWWLRREDTEDVGKRLGIKVVPIVGQGDLSTAVCLAEDGFQSQWGDFRAEGLVLRPLVDLCDRNGNRILAKIKHKDFA